MGGLFYVVLLSCELREENVRAISYVILESAHVTPVTHYHSGAFIVLAVTALRGSILARHAALELAKRFPQKLKKKENIL